MTLCLQVAVPPLAQHAKGNTTHGQRVKRCKGCCNVRHVFGVASSLCCSRTGLCTCPVTVLHLHSNYQQGLCGFQQMPARPSYQWIMPISRGHPDVNHTTGHRSLTWNLAACVTRLGCARPGLRTALPVHVSLRSTVWSALSSHTLVLTTRSELGSAVLQRCSPRRNRRRILQVLQPSLGPIFCSRIPID